LINGKIETKVSKIKKEKGKDIWLFGGAGLTTSFINKNLIDEIMLAVHPILLGAGKPLFKDIEKRVELTLIDTKRFTTGLVQLTYELKSGEKTRKKAKKS
jgi:dihydrofolate reductase